jgi:hypothetical protein
MSWSQSDICVIPPALPEDGNKSKNAWQKMRELSTSFRQGAVLQMIMMMMMKMMRKIMKMMKMMEMMIMMMIMHDDDL